MSEHWPELTFHVENDYHVYFYFSDWLNYYEQKCLLYESSSAQSELMKCIHMKSLSLSGRLFSNGRFFSGSSQ